jgi:hypothetical protein
MKRMVLAYLLGILSVVAFAYDAGPDAIVQCGLRLAAMQQTYAYDATPMHVVDEQMIVAELARPVAKRKGK